MSDAGTNRPESPDSVIHRFADAVNAFEVGAGPVEGIVELYAQNCAAGNVVLGEVRSKYLTHAFADVL